MTGVLSFLQTKQVIALAVSDFPTDVSGFGDTGAVASITTGLVAATASGGTPAYSYAWTQVTPSPYTWTITAPTAASTAFTCGSLGPGNTAEATFRVTVTDAAGATATADVSAFANNGQPYDNRIDRFDRSGPLL